MLKNLVGKRVRARTLAEWAGRRFWESRQFYSAYIALFIAVSNWITIQYRLLLENIPIFNTLFSQLWIFLIVAVVVFTVVSVPDDNVSRELLANKATEGNNVFSSRERTIISNELTDKGKYVSANLQVLVEKVYVAPYAESWFEEVVESLLSKYDLDPIVIKSDLYTIS